MKRAYLGLGSNMGGKIENLNQAVKLIADSTGIELIKVSGIYETAPVGYTEQDDFANLCVEIATDLSPIELLKVCNFVENELGRVRLIRWGPRTLDVDVLLYEDFQSDDEVLTVPHPRMWERAFVMIPLEEISKDMNESDHYKLTNAISKLNQEDKLSVCQIGKISIL